jgi:FkbM family methyltransferase
MREGPAKRALRAAWRNLPFKLPMLRALRAVWQPPQSVYQHLHFEGEFEVEVAPGARFRIRAHGTHVENDLFWSGYAGNWERVSVTLWRDLCRGAGTVLDVGANTGVYALAAAALSPGARIAAFEPVPRVCARLRHNAALNGNRIAVEQAAVSDRDGTAVLHDLDDDHVYSASLEREMLGDAYSRTYEVPSVTLDSYCAAQGIGRVDLMKIDVERHEPAVLRGARQLIVRDRPAMLCEVLDEAIGRAVAAELTCLGYVAYAISERDGVTPAAKLGGVDRNYLICTPETASRLGLPAAPALA